MKYSHPSDSPALVTSLYFWIIVVVLLMSAGYGVLVWVRKPAYALILASIPLAALLFYRFQQRLFFAPVLIFIAAAYTRFYIATGTMSTVVDSFLLTMFFVGIWVLRDVVVHRRFRLEPFPINGPIIGFMITVVISIVWAFVFRDPAVVWWDTFIYVQLATATVMIMLPAITLFLGNNVSDLRILKILVVMMLVTGALGFAWDNHWIHLEVQTGGLFTMWIVCLTVGLAIFNTKLPKVWRFLLVAGAGAWIYYRFGLNITWLAGWLPSFAVLFTLVFMRDKRFLFILVVVLLVVVLSNLEYYQGVLQAEQGESGNTRISAWIRNWQITRNHLLFGTGPGGYVPYLMAYYPKGAMATHSNYIDVLAETGIVGLFFYLWFFIRMALMGYRLAMRTRGQRDFVEAMANVAFAGTMGCIFSMFFGDWLIPFPYTQGIAAFDYISYSWIFMGFTLVLERMTRVAPYSTRQVQQGG